MAAITWVEIASWHILKFDDPEAVLCGLEVSEEDVIKDEIDATDKTCENCLRIFGLRSDEESVVA
jgi:hypothetical protein